MPGYKQPCRVAVMRTDADHDLYLVPDDTLSTTGIPASLPLAGPMLTGHVFERSPEGIQRLPGASIVLDFSGGMGWGPVANTVTDATGGYVLCNLSTPVLGIYAYVTKPGYKPAYVLVTPGQTGSFEIELERQSAAGLAPPGPDGSPRPPRDQADTSDPASIRSVNDRATCSRLDRHPELREQEGEYTSTSCSIASASGVPMPWPVPALVRSRTVPRPAVAACSRAVILRECIGSTRGSFAPVRNSTAG